MRRRVRKVCLVLTVFALGFIYVNSYEVNKGVRVEEFSNIYDGESIEIAYEKLKGSTNEKIDKLEKTYSIKKLCDKDEEIDKILKSITILKAIGQKDDVKETNFSNGYDILKNQKEKSKKFSDRDMAIIQRDLILALGYECRIGIFRKESPQFEKNADYYVVEYWSPKENKWILIDYKRNGFIKRDGEKIGALELLESKIEQIQFNGEYKNKDYKREIREFLNSYSIPIDNTIDRKESNSYITYIKNEKDIDLLSEGEYIPPTIFTKNKILFEKSPWSGRKKEDEKGYLILMKKSLDEEDKKLKGEDLEREKNKVILGCYKNGVMQKKYKYKINDSEYIEIKNKYEEIYLPLGKTKITILAGDGEKESSLVINRENKK